MSNPFMGEAITSGVSQVQDYSRERPYREARLAEAQTRQKMSEAQLQDFQANAPVRSAQRDAELVRLEQQTYQINSELARSQTYNAFQLYNADGDTRHLNNFISQSKNNPVARSLTQGVVRFDPLDNNEETKRKLKASGVQDVDGLMADKSLTKSLVFATLEDGSRELVDMNVFYGATGYDRYTTDQTRKELAANVAVLSQLRNGANLSDIKADDAVVGQIAEMLGVSRSEAYKLLKEKPGMGQAAGSTQIERVASELRASNPELSFRDSLIQAGELVRAPQRPTDQARFVEQYMQENEGATPEQALSAYREAGRDNRTSGIKNIEYTEEAKALLDQEFGGDFLSADLTNLTSRQQANLSNYLNRIEQVGGLNLSQEDHKNARNIRKLLLLGGTVGEELTSAQTGPIDSVLRTVKNYISDNVEGKEATTSYEAFRSIMRNVLFGSQVSGADYSAFNKAFATLGQQTGPVLSSLRTQMNVIREDLDAMLTLNDPYVAKARFGISLDKAQDIVNAIDERLDIISGIQRGRPNPNLTVPQVSATRINVAPAGQPPAERPPLESFFQTGGN